MKLDWCHNGRYWIALKTNGLGPSETKIVNSQFLKDDTLY